MPGAEQLARLIYTLGHGAGQKFVCSLYGNVGGAAGSGNPPGGDGDMEPTSTACDADPGQSRLDEASGMAIETPVGSMEGSYQMVTDDGLAFDANIPAFTLSLPNALH